MRSREVLRSRRGGRVSRVSLWLCSRRSEYGRRWSLARGLESRGAIMLVLVLVLVFVDEVVERGSTDSREFSDGSVVCDG